MKWLLIGVAVLLVVAISVGATLLFTRDNGGGGGGGEKTATASSSSPPPSDIASADDTGPVSVITADPTCAKFLDTNDKLIAAENSGWADERASIGDAPNWNVDQQARAKNVAATMSTSANEMVVLAKQTPHRVVRELYEQFVAYSRAYVLRIPKYVPSDNALADTAVNIQNTLVGICTAIQQGSASGKISLEPIDPPSAVAPIGDIAQPERFLTKPNASCGTWEADGQAYAAATREWEKLVNGSALPSQWTTDDRATHKAALLVMSTFATQMETTGRRSANPTFEDLAVLAAAYLRAFVATADVYSDAVSWLNYTMVRVNNSVSSACRAATS